MKPKKNNLKNLIIIGTICYVFLIFFCVHLCAYQAYYPFASFIELISVTFKGIQAHPFQLIHFPDGVFSYILGLSLIYGLAIFYMIADSQRNRHISENIANGSSQWNHNEAKYNKTYSAPYEKKTYDGETNMIMTHTIRLNMDTRKTRRNCNVVIIGGSGSGKSRFFVKPNLCEMPLNCNFVVTDPSGEMIQSTGKMLSDAGFKIKSFNLVNMQASNCYNPLKYIKTEDDIIVLVDCILKNTTDPNAKGGDAFWEKSQQMMLNSFVGALWKYGGEKNPNDPNDTSGTLTFNGKKLPKTLLSIMELIRGCTIDENDKKSTQEMNATDAAFNQLRIDIKEKFGKDTDFCLKQYDGFKMGAGKTLKSILISAIARLSAFDVEGLRRLTCSDNIDLDKIGDEKTALFIILPTAQGTFNFVASMMYSQLFQSLYYHAEKECLGNYVVYDSAGEVVKVFEIPHYEEEYFDENINAEEIELSETIVKKSIFSIFNFKKKNKEKQKTLSDEEKMNEDVDNNYDEKAINEKIDDGMKNLTSTQLINKQEGIKLAEQSAKQFISDAKNAKVFKKGSKYITKVGDEIVGWYGSESIAWKHLNRLKNCTYGKLGLRLPFHVRFLMDEFANIGEIPDFTQKLSTMRKYEISCTIILQSISQIKKMYEKDWGVILGNCDSLLFLGCPEYDTQEYISKRLGKTTVKIRNSSVSKGSKGSHSLSFNLTARDLLTPDEVGLLSDSECIYFLRGEHPFRVPKYKYEKHPNYKYTADADFNNTYQFRPPAISNEDKEILYENSSLPLTNNTNDSYSDSKKMSLSKAKHNSEINKYMSSSEQNEQDFVNNYYNSKNNSSNDIVEPTFSNSSKFNKNSSNLSDKDLQQNEIKDEKNSEDFMNELTKKDKEEDIFSEALILTESIALNHFYDNDDESDMDIDDNLFESSVVCNTTSN